MRTPLNYLLFNLAVTDTMIGVLSLPMIVFRFISHEAEDTAAMLLCKFVDHGTGSFTCGQVSVFSLAAIAFERYEAVVHPLTVKEKITVRKTFVFILINWILAISVTIPWYFGLDLDGSVPQKCKVKADYQEAIELILFICGHFAYGGALVFITVLYFKIIWVFFKKQN